MRKAILVSTPVDEGLKEQVRAGLIPQRDFFALADALEATLITPAKTSPKGGKVSSAVRFLSCAWAAFRRRHQYDLIISDTDRVGLILALLFKLAGVRRRHLIISHGEINLPWERRILKVFQLHTQIDRIIFHGEAEKQRFAGTSRFAPHQIVGLRHTVDHHFWHPSLGSSESIIASAGLYQRDYRTLIEAVRGLDVSLEIAPFSPWEPGGRTLNPDTVPANVRSGHYDPVELRDLYARSLFVAVPLYDTVDQAGSTVIYEAMAMGKAIVSTGTKGLLQLDVVKQGETGLFVSPGDIQGWREALVYLCDHPGEAVQMGQRARSMVEEKLNLESYVRDMVDLVEQVATP